MKSETGNPWLYRFTHAKLKLNSHVGRLVNKNIGELGDELAINSRHAEHQMKNYLENCYVVTESIYSIARAMISHFESLTIMRYPSVRKFIELIHLENCDFLNEVGYDQDNKTNPICISGLSGEGKSEFIRYFYSLFDIDNFPKDIDLSSYPNMGWDELNIGDKRSAAAIISSSKLTKNNIGQYKYGKSAYANGVIGFGVDEFQFTTGSGVANTQVTKILMDLRGHCVPWFYVCNFSLLWKLRRRNHEDINRLLSDVKILKINMGNTEEEKFLLSVSYIKILTSPFHHLLRDVDDFSEKVSELSRGVPKYIAKLISIGYRIRHETQSEFVETTHIQKAYKSTYFSSERKITEVLRNTSSWLINKKMYDLVVPPEYEKLDDNTGAESYNHSSDYNALLCSLTREERNHLKSRKVVDINKKITTISAISKEVRLKQGMDYLDKL